MAADRILNIKATATSNWVDPQTLHANITWQQTGQTGLDKSPGGSRVDPVSGDINLMRMWKNTAFTNNVRIQITLDDQMTDYSGKKVHSQYADLPGDCWFMLKCGDTQTINPLGVTSTRVSNNLVRIQDNRVINIDPKVLGDNVPFAFSLGMIVKLPTGDRPVTLDPGVGGKGTGVTPIEDDESC